jgi:hypothetical protein
MARNRRSTVVNCSVRLIHWSERHGRFSGSLTIRTWSTYRPSTDATGPVTATELRGAPSRAYATPSSTLAARFWTGVSGGTSLRRTPDLRSVAIGREHRPVGEHAGEPDLEPAELVAAVGETVELGVDEVRPRDHGPGRVAHAPGPPRVRDLRQAPGVAEHGCPPLRPSRRTPRAAHRGPGVAHVGDSGGEVPGSA